jgi:hypothetical protein
MLTPIVRRGADTRHVSLRVTTSSFARDAHDGSMRHTMPQSCRRLPARRSATILLLSRAASAALSAAKAASGTWPRTFSTRTRFMSKSLRRIRSTASGVSALALSLAPLEACTVEATVRQMACEYTSSGAAASRLASARISASSRRPACL